VQAVSRLVSCGASLHTPRRTGKRETSGNPQVDTDAARGHAWAMSDVELKELVASLALAQKTTQSELDDLGRYVKHLEGVHAVHFGRLVEAIVAPSCLKLFQARGIKVTESMRRVEKLVDGEQLEIDVLLANGREVVAVEVKSALRVRDVADALADVKRFRQGFPHYAKHRLYGAVAALEYLEESDRFAARKGLFVLKSAGGLMEIANPLNFRAKEF
jgi:hypothetical protein